MNDVAGCGKAPIVDRTSRSGPRRGRILSFDSLALMDHLRELCTAQTTLAGVPPETTWPVDGCG